MKLRILFIIAFLSFSFILSGGEAVKTPEEFFGFKPGTDRMLFNYEKLIGYFKLLDGQSPKLKLEQIGTSPMGKPMFIAFISSEKNISNLQEIKKINRRLALDTDIPEGELEEIVKTAPVSFLATLSMHADEVGPAQAAPLIAHDLITSDKENVRRWLEHVVFMMVPSHNPDGMDMVVGHYLKYKGTKYEGSHMPGVYHKYVGHDNNRDFVTLTQADTKAIARIYNLEWFPQVMVEKHQMGSTTARYYVPPNHDPIAENIDAGIWNWAGIFGSNMITDMTRDGLAGVSQHYLFDDYWPGSTETCIWKNVIGFLTEAASTKDGVPVYIEPNELRGYGKGLSEYEKSINMPLPWEGGWWRLGDIVKYEISSTYSILKTAANHREAILRYRNELCRKEAANGRTIPPYFYILPLEQHDRSELVSLVNLLQEHGVMTYSLNRDFEVRNRLFRKGDVVIPLSQPFRPFIKEVLESQKFPVRHYTPGGEIIEPYDITSWSLPLHNGVESHQIDIPCNDLYQEISANQTVFKIVKPEPVYYSHLVFPVSHNESFRAAFSAAKAGLKVFRLKEDVKLDSGSFAKGSFVIEKQNGKKLKLILDSLSVSPAFASPGNEISLSEFKTPRIALVETWFHDMDAGWTRFLLDSYSIPYTMIRPAEIEGLNLQGKFDVILFPDMSPSVLSKGKYKSDSDYFSPSYPPDYTKGMGAKGLNKVISFIDGGGTVVSWGESTGLFMGEHEIKNAEGQTESFSFPVRDISEQAKKKGLNCPGSFLRLVIPSGHPLTLGMNEKPGIFYSGAALFRTRIPAFDMDRRVIGKFPKDRILLSGYCEHEETLANETAMVWIRKNKGQLILMAFSPQFRASTGGTYKLLFNSILSGRS